MVKLYIDNVDHGGGVISTYQVEQPTYSFRLNDPGDCSWEIALSQTRVGGGNLIENEFAPKRTDYVLKTAAGTELQGGRLLSVGLESDTGLIKCSGKDWLEYLDQPWPFDYSLTPETLAQNVDKVFKAYIDVAGTDTNNILYNITQQKILQNFITIANTLSDITYNPVFFGTNWTEVMQYFIQYLDSTTILSHIKAIAALNDPLGFDFWCDWDKTIYFYSPRIVAHPSSVITAIDLAYNSTDPVVHVVWENHGPKATHTVAKNSGGIWKESIYTPSVDQFREFLEIIDLAERFNIATTATILKHLVAVGADAVGTLDRNPQKDLILQAIPERLFSGSEEGGFQSLVGQAISYDSVDEFAPYHRINAEYFVVTQDFKTEDDSGNFIVELGLQQIY
jgi:hypothetical protein